jgi:phage tail P2-like protein
MDHLLPPSASDAQRHRAVAIARISEVPVPITDLWSPERCPVTHLPWLAWALSVDHWSPDWPEARQRAVVAAAFDFHATKGTRHAVEQALALIGVEADITEWWEAEPTLPQGTFQLAAQVPAVGGPLLADDIRDAVALVNRAKRASQHMSFWLQTHAEQQIGLAGGIGSGARKSAAVQIRAAARQATAGLAASIGRVARLQLTFEISEAT